MTPKEKAIELFMKFEKHTYEHPAMSSKELRDEVKICCLIAFDEIIEECSNWSGGGNMEWEVERYKYWQQVKNEIELL